MHSTTCCPGASARSCRPWMPRRAATSSKIDLPARRSCAPDVRAARCFAAGEREAICHPGRAFTARDKWRACLVEEAAWRGAAWSRWATRERFHRSAVRPGAGDRVIIIPCRPATDRRCAASRMRTMKPELGIAGRLAQRLIGSKLTPLFIVASLAARRSSPYGKLPREEEPQIIVPMVDVFVQMPGASPREVEERVTKPMEKLLWEIPGVEYIYSTSSPGVALAIVRFQVGEDEESSIVRLNQKMHVELRSAFRPAPRCRWSSRARSTTCRSWR